ncbi:hypothetical protein RB195_025675 [Necator americanus]|uniref:Uncharacterized protein n=1 Tax=Necator americanus TaxID=51031 RepID=A0ABR1ETD6_NECAM
MDLVIRCLYRIFWSDPRKHFLFLSMCLFPTCFYVNRHQIETLDASIAPNAAGRIQDLSSVQTLMDLNHVASILRGGTLPRQSRILTATSLILTGFYCSICFIVLKNIYFFPLALSKIYANGRCSTLLLLISNCLATYSTAITILAPSIVNL